ncbi:uncharacterized protein EI90DRAFT_3075243 [Cantharellus anzutake]|uniref:uncharacterized protein n=1 Tax=Cantharellus anzutake TaxID=1750568 RepID=UPI001906B2C1|nr:uncharacterized protein EI90DRAFT_3075243 [Cantharellus anzutake]KAF8324621.1 hypothetical protein EI90DRAFT_3075243 [Cantharellus anzutake]
MNYGPDPLSILLQSQSILPVFVAAGLVLFAVLSNIASVANMLFENLGLSYVMDWIGNILRLNGDDLDVPGEKNDNVVELRSRDGLRLLGRHPTESQDHQWYPGLVNVSGTYCFMNSVLQAFSSLSYLQPHVEEVYSRAEAHDIPTPVTDAVRNVLKLLNTPSSSRTSHRPIEIINVLSAPSNDGKRSLLFSSREHQDAQELFQLLSSLMKDESLAVHREVRREQGLSSALISDSARGGFSPIRVTKSVFDGLTANRRSCMVCGYTEAVMHFGFDNLQLTLPFAASITLQDCLADLTRLEVLTDSACRKCSLVAMHTCIQHELAHGGSDEKTSGKSTKKRVREMRKLEILLKAALTEGRIEEDIRGLKVERVVSRASKQVMIARAPQILVLHLNRSIYHGSAAKNPCRVQFPEVLDLTPFTTSGQLSVLPSSPISSLPLRLSTYQNSRRILYRLAATVCHYGAHSFGHYIAYRRKPSHGTPLSPWLPSLLSTTNEDWLRISDDSVDEVGINYVLSETSGTFLLFYERIIPHQDYPSHDSNGVANLDLVSDSSQLDACPSLPQCHLTPRIVRSLSTGYAREQSAAHPIPQQTLPVDKSSMG